ncbi:MAG: hypothetical protein A2269_05200 [Lentisphaerae bacterium RIFOXYA12_FULL_60_10]|nr:MAG: hypothetical protein A2269_05200 [Lentisphaerae bacterium RIFOXYA12_FULL_60_10]
MAMIMPAATSNGLLIGSNLDDLRKKMDRPPFKQAFSEMVQRVHDTAEKDRATDKLTSHGWCHSHFFTPAVLEAGFVHAVTGDPAAAAHVARQVGKLVRVYADPPESFYRELGPTGRPSSYFSNVLTGLAVRLCGEGLPPGTYDTLLQLMRTRLIDDCHKPEYYFTHFNAGHNAVVTHVVSAAICSLLFGRECGHPDTDRMIALGRDACIAHLRWGFDDEGTPHEGPMYAFVTLEWVFLYADLLRRHGGEDLFRTRPEFTAILDANINLQLPGFRGVSGFDDCRNTIVAHPMPWLPFTAREFNRPQDLALWHQLHDRTLSLGTWKWSRNWFSVLELLWWDGSPPPSKVPTPPTAHIGQGKAVAVFRTSWNDNATCVTLLGQGRSHNIPDHTHADAGHFSIFTHGELPAYDTAYFNFDEDVHSVVLIDGKPFHHTTQGNLYAGRFMAVERHPLLDYVAVDASGARGCMWAHRHFLFVRGAGDTCYLVVLDNINKDNGIHSFAWQLQGNLDTTIRVTGERQAVVEGKASRLDCHFFNPLAEDYPTCPHQLTLTFDQHLHRNIQTGEPETNPRLVADQKGCNGSLMAVIVPRGIAEAALTIRDATASRTFNAFIEHGDFVDQVIYAGDHIYVRLPGVQAESEIAVIRRDRSGRVLDTWTCDGRPVRTD